MSFSSRRKLLALFFFYGFVSVLFAAYGTVALAQTTPLRVDPALLGLPPIKPAEAPAPAEQVVKPVESKSVAVKPEVKPEIKPEVKPVEIKSVETATVESQAVENKTTQNQSTARPRDAASATSAESAATATAVKKASGAPAPDVRAMPSPSPTPAPTPARTPRVVEPEPPKAVVAPAATAVPVVPVAPQVAQPSPTPTPPTPPATQPTAPTVAQAKPVQAPSNVPIVYASPTSVSTLAPLRVDPALLGEVLAPPAIPAPSSFAARSGGVPVAQAATAVSAAQETNVAGSGQTTKASAKTSSGSERNAGTQATQTTTVANDTTTNATTTSPAYSAPVVVAEGVPTGSVPPKRAENNSWWQKTKDSVSAATDRAFNVYNEGALEFYLPLKTYHSRSSYTQEQIDSYQENPLGFGVGRGLYNEKGNWEGVYFLAFQDSHSKPSYTGGYGWKAIWHPAEDVRFGLGYNGGLMARSDTMHYFPFPVIFPVASLGFKNFSVEATFIPPVGDKGNVLFVNAKWEMGKKGEPIGTPAPPPPPPPQLTYRSFGAATPLAQRMVPYGPVVTSNTTSGSLNAESAGVSASVTNATSATNAPGPAVWSAPTTPPRVASTGPRDEEEVPDPLPALALRNSQVIEDLPRSSAIPRPVFVSGQRMGGQIDREFTAEVDAELRKIGTSVNADRLTYWPVDDEVEAEGKVRIVQGEDVITGPKTRLNLEKQLGYFEQPSYTLKRISQAKLKSTDTLDDVDEPTKPQGLFDFSSGFAPPRQFNLKPGQTKLKEKRVPYMSEARGDADRLDFEGENQMRLTNATYTTCEPGNDDWYLQAKDIKLDYDHELGEGEDATLYFKGVPIVYSPWFSFSLNQQRKSGFLPPSFGTDSLNGFDLRVPYYWNIAPNRDATIAEHVFGRRGVQTENEFRYLDQAFGGEYRGTLRGNYLPNDKLRDGDNRWAFGLEHVQTSQYGLSGLINYTKVSDNNYFTDLSRNIGFTSQTQLLQQGMLNYNAGWWNATLNTQQYQTLQPDPKNPVQIPYKLMPQATIRAQKNDWHLTDFNFFGEYTDFKIDTHTQVVNGVSTNFPNAQRAVLYPSLALPYITPGWYVTPKVGVNVRRYALTEQTVGTPDSITSTLPIFSVDSGMTFERPSTWFGREYAQTLEPRLYYLNIPYKNQNNIPLFDTALSDFNFAQIFSENQFSGWDRINNANQLTAALSTRLLDQSGNEVMRAMFGQRTYFTSDKVQLNSNSAVRKWNRSDLLGSFSGQILPHLYADTAIQYSPNNSEVNRFSLGTRYEPEPGKVLNAAYRYNRDSSAPVDQIDVSGQWPLSGKLHAVGRFNYSFENNRQVESLGGLEYNGGCWTVRSVVHRLATTQNTSSTAFFIQLEFNDFARIGSNPFNLLRRSIPGYRLINQPENDSAYGG